MSNELDRHTITCTGPTTLQVECDTIILRERSMDLVIDVPTEKIKAIDYLILNGIKFSRLPSTDED